MRKSKIYTSNLFRKDSSFVFFKSSKKVTKLINNEKSKEKHNKKVQEVKNDTKTKITIGGLCRRNQN